MPGVSSGWRKGVKVFSASRAATEKVWGEGGNGRGRGGGERERERQRERDRENFNTQR